jgi:hypothetical protein
MSGNSIQLKFINDVPLCATGLFDLPKEDDDYQLTTVNIAKTAFQKDISVKDESLI